MGRDRKEQDGRDYHGITSTALLLWVTGYAFRMSIYLGLAGWLLGTPNHILNGCCFFFIVTFPFIIAIHKSIFAAFCFLLTFLRHHRTPALSNSNSNPKFLRKLPLLQNPPSVK